MDQEKVYRMPFSKIYPLLANKAMKKGRTREEVNAVICWLTGYGREQLETLANSAITYREFFDGAPHLNENRLQIRGTVCGVRVEDVQQPLMRAIRYLDKLIDELAKGKPLDKVLR